MKRPRVTVVLTSLNRSELLATALRSLQMQDYLEWECIVVDDGSTDDAVLLAQRFAGADSRFTVIVHGRSLGVSAARNTGLAAARGEYVCFLDDDDFLLAGSLRDRVERLDGAPPDVAGAYCDWVNTEPDSGLEVMTRRMTASSSRNTIRFVDLQYGAPFIVSSPLIRRTVLLEVGGFDEEYAYAEDAELWGRVLRLGFSFLYVASVGVAYRRSPDSTVTMAPVRQLLMLDQVHRKWETEDLRVSGCGPRPATEGLGTLAVRAAFAPQVCNYLAMVSYFDTAEAERLVPALLPNVVRAGLDLDAVRSHLERYVRARLRLTDESDLLRMHSSIGKLLQSVAVAPSTSWVPLLSEASWAGRHGRGRRFHPAPATVPARGRVAGAVVLIAEARYHVDELGPLADELRSRGIEICFMESPKTVASARLELGAYTREIVSFAPDLVADAAAVVVLNDWGPTRELVERANEAGVPTFAKVEGVQDFDDVDTGRTRDPYRTAAVVLGQGVNDVESLAGRRVEVVGSSRLERIWLQPPAELGAHALVNVNFTFRVLTEHRDEWVSSVAEALDRSGRHGLISCHPAERQTSFGLPVATKPFRYEITRAGLLISRFSTVPFEAMARGVPFVYHNPHGELVPTFARPAGAFGVTRSTSELAEAINTWSSATTDDYRSTAREFFLRQVDVDASARSEERAAEIILAAIT